MTQDEKRADRERTDRGKVNEQAVDWVLLAESGELTEAESRALEDWLAADPAHRKAFDKARLLYSDTGAALTADPGLTKRMIGGRRRGGPAIGLIAVIAGCALYLASGPLWLTADFVSGSSEMPVVDLPDGSRVQLNAESAMAERLTDERREVTLLEGEAYFEVSKSGIPFYVNAGAGQIEVLGTAFNVNRVGGGVEVSVTEHQVRVSTGSSSRSVLLEPGMRVFYDGDGNMGGVETVASGMEAPWRSGRLVFDDEALPDVVDEIFRHLPGSALVVPGDLRARKVTGSFDLTDPEAAFESFTEVFGLRATRAAGLLTVIY